MALHTVTVSLEGVFQDAGPFTGRMRFRLCRPSSYEDSIAVLPKRWQEVDFASGSMSVQLVPNALLLPENTWYEYEIHEAQTTRLPKTLLKKGCISVPDRDCSFLEIVTGPVEDAPASAEAFASQAKQAARDAAASATDAGNAQTAAETAQGKAEEAQGSAERAQTAAETAQGKAEDAQTAAETAQGKAEAAQTAAEAAASKIWTAYATAESEEAAEQIDMSSLTDGGLMIVTINS